MIEFTLNRNRNGKKSRGTKKYPRKRIFMKAEVVAKFAVWFVIFHYPNNLRTFEMIFQHLIPLRM